MRGPRTHRSRVLTPGVAARLGFAALLAATALAAGGCRSRPHVDAPPGTVVDGPDRADALLGLPPLWFARRGPGGYVAVPILGSYYAEEVHFTFLALLNVGWTSVTKNVTEGGEEATRTVDRELNLIGLHRQTIERVRTPSRIVDRRDHYLFGFVPLYATEETQTEAGGVRRRWLFGFIPLD